MTVYELIGKQAMEIEELKAELKAVNRLLERAEEEILQFQMAQNDDEDETLQLKNEIARLSQQTQTDPAGLIAIGRMQVINRVAEFDANVYGRGETKLSDLVWDMEKETVPDHIIAKKVSAVNVLGERDNKYLIKLEDIE
jgi:streptomycin 6-kinase